MNARLRSARLAAGLSQGQLAELVNRAVKGHLGALDATTVSRTERGVIALPGQHYVDAYCLVLGATAAELGFTAHPELSYALEDPSKVDHAALRALSDMLLSARKLEDAVSAKAVLPTVEYNRTIVESFTKQAKFAIRPHALDLLNEYGVYVGWIRLATGDYNGAQNMFDKALAVGVEAQSDVGIADSLSFKGYADLEANNPLSGASLTQAANKYKHTNSDKTYFNLLIARCLATAGEFADCDKFLLQADKTLDKSTEDELTTRNYWYTQAWLVIERGLVHAAAGRNAMAIQDITDGLAGLSPDLYDSEWVAKYHRILESL